MSSVPTIGSAVLVFDANFGFDVVNARFNLHGAIDRLVDEFDFLLEWVVGIEYGYEFEQLAKDVDFGRE